MLSHLLLQMAMDDLSQHYSISQLWFPLDLSPLSQWIHFVSKTLIPIGFPANQYPQILNQLENRDNY